MSLPSKVGEGRGLAQGGREVGRFFIPNSFFIFALNECKFSDGSVCVKRMDRTCCMSCMGEGLTWGCLWASGLGPNLGLKWAISPIGKKKRKRKTTHAKKTINKTKNMMINNNLKIKHLIMTRDDLNKINTTRHLNDIKEHKIS